MFPVILRLHNVYAGSEINGSRPSGITSVVLCHVNNYRRECYIGYMLHEVLCLYFQESGKQFHP